MKTVIATRPSLHKELHTQGALVISAAFSHGGSSDHMMNELIRETYLFGQNAPLDEAAGYLAG
jgi:hypothetical protein